MSLYLTTQIIQLCVVETYLQSWFEPFCPNQAGHFNVVIAIVAGQTWDGKEGNEDN